MEKIIFFCKSNCGKIQNGCLFLKMEPVLPSIYKINLNPCSQCQFTSFQPYVLKQHILKKHTKTIKYECDECSFSTYSGHKAVRMHKKKMHNGQKISKAIFLLLILQKIKRNDLPNCAPASKMAYGSNKSQ